MLQMLQPQTPLDPSSHSVNTTIRSIPTSHVTILLFYNDYYNNILILGLRQTVGGIVFWFYIDVFVSFFLRTLSIDQL